MFVFNLKIKSKKLFKTVLIVSFILAISLFLLAGFNIIKELLENKNHNEFEIPSPDVAEISPDNYTNILKEVHENIDTYIGQKISFIGYVYRVSDLKDDEFILARDMLLENMNQTVVVGFLSKYDKAKDYQDGSWIKVTGEIQKGNYHGEIPYINVISIEEVEPPATSIVKAPMENYVPTAVIY